MGLFDRWRKGGGAEESEPTPPGFEPGYADVDPRVATLLTDFEQKRFGLTPAGTVDFETCRDAVLTLHGEVSDEKSLVALLRFHGALMGSGVEGLRREGRDPAALEALWREDYFTMLTKEVVDGSGDVDPDAVERVNRREQEAGRLAEGERFHVQRAPEAGTRQEGGAPTARFVGERAIALWTVVLRAIAPAQRETLLQSFAAEGSRDWLTGAEIDFLLDAQPAPETLVAFGWQAERLAVLLWAVGLADLPGHDSKCDPIAFATLVPPTSQMPFDAFLAGLQLRDKAEIERVAADINDSYWAASAAEAEGRPAPAGVDIEILDERLRAIAWVRGQAVPEWP